MQTWSFYNLATGLFTGKTYSAPDESQLAANTPPGEAALEGVHDSRQVRFDLTLGGLVAYQPPAPSADHIWFDAGRAWVLSPAAMQARMARAKIMHIESRQARAVRELALDPTDAAARATLAALDVEIKLERLKLSG